MLPTLKRNDEDKLAGGNACSKVYTNIALSDSELPQGGLYAAELGERVLAGKQLDEHVGTASCNHHKTSQLLFDQVGVASTLLFISIYYSFPGCGPSELQKPILPVAENHGDEIPRALCAA